MFGKPDNNKRSPLDRKPLRAPGQSIQEELDRLLDEDALPAIMLAIFAVIFAVYEWVVWILKLPLQPIWLTFLAVCAVVYAVYKLRSIRNRAEMLKLGRDGEKYVGQFLEQLRVQGCQVFHDIVSDRFNIDHIVVSPHGIFVIETKTYSKPMRGQTIVEFDGEKILVNGIEPERNAITQVRALGNWLRDLLFQSTSRKFPIKCVVILPGWFVNDVRTKNKSDIWVLNHKALPTYIKNEPIMLKPEDIALISSRMIDYIQKADSKS